MQEWICECEKKKNKQKSGKEFYKDYVKIWSNMDYKIRVGCNNKIVKLEK